MPALRPASVSARNAARRVLRTTARSWRLKTPAPVGAAARPYARPAPCPARPGFPREGLGLAFFH